MKRNTSVSTGLLTRLLLVGLMLTSSGVVFSAGKRAGQELVDPESGTVSPVTALSRSYGLTVVSSQRTAVDISKQNGIKRSVVHSGLSRREPEVPANTLHRLLVTERSPSYLSFRLSRPGGRAPPVSA